MFERLTVDGLDTMPHCGWGGHRTASALEPIGY